MASACVGEPDESTRTQGVLEGNAIAVNAIAVNAIALNAIALNAIALNQISNNLFQLNSTDLLQTADGRELLTYIVSCALPHSVTLTGAYAGVTYSFAGDLGLAPKWLKRSLRPTEENWVSACLIARVNLYGIPVSISLRGAHPALAVGGAEGRDYSVEEGAFYGNVFHGVNEPLIWNTCRGKDQAAGESGTLDLRDCAEPDPAHPGLSKCGFTYAGDCADWAPPRNAYACKSFHVELAAEDDDERKGHDDDADSAGYYTQCYDSPGLGRWPNATRFDEVITVYLMP